jgi:predicted methyltransferase
LLAAAILPLALSACAAEKQPLSESSVRPGINERFLSEDLDVTEYVQVFEGESREVYAQRRNIVASLRLAPGMQVADIGAGTGLFMPALAEAVGAQGKLYAVDIAPRFVDHLRQRASEAQLEQVEIVRATEHSVELPAASVDLAFVCDTYHHFEYPHSTLASLYEALRPGGSLIVVDFERIPGQTPDWVLEHVRAGKDVFSQEIQAAGFEPQGEIELEGLKENYVLRFRRP